MNEGDAIADAVRGSHRARHLGHARHLNRIDAGGAGLTREQAENAGATGQVEDDIARTDDAVNRGAKSVEPDRVGEVLAVFIDDE